MARRRGLRRPPLPRAAEEQMQREAKTDVVLDFPVLLLHPKYGMVVKDWDSLTTSTAAALKNKVFEDLLIVDSSGKAFRVNGAKKLHGIGALGGFNIFLNQKIRVEPIFEGAPSQISVEALKERVFKSFEEWEGWSSASNFEEMSEKVRAANSIKEIIDALS